jgi:hypothetical protein
MAQSTIAARNAALASLATEPEFSFRPLKNRLQSRFPTVKSSHLSEAIAAGLGFNTNAALRAAQAGPDGWQLKFKRLNAATFYQRLVELNYPLQPDFTFGSPPVPPAPPAQYLEWLQQLRELEKAPDGRWPRIYALRKQCAKEFAKTFGLGHLENKDDKKVVKRWSPGIDHGACLPDWGEAFNSNRGGLVDFPGSDHRVHFYESLPLSSGKFVEYEQAMVSMPYVDAMGMPRKLGEAAHLAGRIGWTFSVLPEWSWYAPGATTLVLFRRSTTHTAMLQAWEGSFKRWLIENRSSLNKSAGATRKKVIADIVDCQHLPLNLKDFEDCRERYLKEFAQHLYYGHDEGMNLVFRRLMESWSQQHLQDAEALNKRMGGTTSQPDE